jgi:hypothetical protein
MRDAGVGPWLESRDVQAFLVFCHKNGYVTRPHSNPWIDAHQIKFKGHWMGIVFNKTYKRYTVDKRLSLVVQSFLLDT